MAAPPGTAADRLADLRRHAAALVEAVLRVPGDTAPAARRAAFDGGPDDPAVAAYLHLVREHSDGVTDADVQGLLDAGIGEDAVFELTLAAALGEGERRLRAGLRLLGLEP